MVSLLTKLQANMISKYEELSEKQKQLDKSINHISLLINMNAILVQKVDNG